MSIKPTYLLYLVVCIALIACGTDPGTGDDRVGVETPTDPSEIVDVETDKPLDPDGKGDTRIYFDLDCAKECEAMASGETYGTEAEQLACAMELCGDVLLDAEIRSLQNLRGYEPHDPRTPGTPWEQCKLENMARSYKHFGDPDNGLAPQMGESYGLLMTTPITMGDWNFLDDNHVWSRCDDMTEYITDQWANHDLMGYVPMMHDAIELTVTLQAPEDATGFRVKYVFMSTQFDQGLKDMHRFISEGEYDYQMYFDDKFYIFKNKVGDSFGKRQLINYTDCRWPEFYWMRECTSNDSWCDVGEKICPVSVLSGMGECCYFECDRTGDELDLAGTGFECALDGASDNLSNRGSSTGWLETQWAIQPGEKFELTFHIHNAGAHGGTGGSAAIIDSFQFITNPIVGTNPE